MRSGFRKLGFTRSGALSCGPATLVNEENSMKNILTRFLRCLVAFTVALGAIIPQSATAGMIAADDVAATTQQAAHEQVSTFVSRPEVVKQLQALGISADKAQARVDAMTREEVNLVASKLDALPAGAAISNTELVLLIVLIVVIALAI
jgi:hypothetical protein